MISGTRVGLVELGLVNLVGYVEPPQWTLCVIDVLFPKCWNLLRYLEAFWYSYNHCFL
jgi:hypothetical protein